MSDLWILRSARRPGPASVRKLTQGSRPLLLAAMLGLSSTLVVGTPLALAAPLAGSPGGTLDARSILHPAEQLMDDPDTFTMGVLTDPSGGTIHLRVRDGDIQSFKVDDDTVFRDEAGHRQSQDDLHEGDVVIVTTDGDDDQTADLVVNGGANGFRPGGVFDVGNRLDDRGRWDWRYRPGEAPPFDPRRLGAISHHFFDGYQTNGGSDQHGQRYDQRYDQHGHDVGGRTPRQFGWGWNR
jgi:hypothetical protein